MQNNAGQRLYWALLGKIRDCCSATAWVSGSRVRGSGSGSCTAHFVCNSMGLRYGLIGHPRRDTAEHHVNGKNTGKWRCKGAHCCLPYRVSPRPSAGLPWYMPTCRPAAVAEMRAICCCVLPPTNRSVLYCCFAPCKFILPAQASCMHRPA